MKRFELEKFKKALNNNGKPMGEIMEIIYTDFHGEKRAFIPWIKISPELYSVEDAEEEGEEEGSEDVEGSIPLYNCWN